MSTACKIMNTIRQDSTISANIKNYLQYVFSKRSSEDFYHAVSKTLGYIPF